MDEALANLGKMQVRTFDDPEMKNRTPPTREAQVMIRHPNYTGMQMDQLTREYTRSAAARAVPAQVRSDARRSVSICATARRRRRGTPG